MPTTKSTSEEQLHEFAPGYFISSAGRVWSGPKMKWHGGKEHSGRWMAPGLAGAGYRFVNVCGRTRYVHRLVAEAFVPNPEGKATVNHKNGVKTDNRACNLEWMTKTEQQQHALATGLRRRRLAECHPQEKHFAHGKCKACYMRDFQTRKRRLIHAGLS